MDGAPTLNEFSTEVPRAMTFIETLVGFIIGLAANATTDAIQTERDRKLRQSLSELGAVRKALDAVRSTKEEVSRACVELARNSHRVGITPQEEPLWRLLNDEIFQCDLAEWFAAGGIEEGNAVKTRLIERMTEALSTLGVSDERIKFLETQYFETIDRAIFSHPVLANWRHHLSLNYLRDQVAFLRKQAAEAAGVYPPEKRKHALATYCERALAQWDIIDLSNLPEGDVAMATQRFLLRRLYMPLRLTVEISREEGGRDDDSFSVLESGRRIRRFHEAGWVSRRESVPEKLKDRSPVGQRLGNARRLVVLGDPGGGKTTMMRWMATAFLLRCRKDGDLDKFPDVKTLPSQSWIPVLIRCRDLGDADLCRGFPDFLAQHLRKTELLPEDAGVMAAVILNSIATGEVLLLVDGLDEISNPRVRMMFCQELERTATRYPDAPIVVTSRIVGYRDMPYRMGKGFEHCVIADLTREDKDLFAKRWVEATEGQKPPGEQQKLIQDLLEALHSSDRIERLTTNPMLLTTLALVKRKVGKLPSQRTKLYQEAVSVLLNWNPQCYETIEEQEAVPQLECIAYEMCLRGVQSLTEDELLELLEKFREDYKKIRVMGRRKPHEFLELLEQRSSILIKSGYHWLGQNGKQEHVWEFRHLTFQEYLAAQALLDGRYLGRDSKKSLAEQVASLAGPVQQTEHLSAIALGEMVVAESWRETLRLLVVDCKHYHVDDVLEAIMRPLTSENPVETARPRTVLAANCLADEPNVSDEVAAQILESLAAQVSQPDGFGEIETMLDEAALNIAKSEWGPLLRISLVREFLRRSAADRAHPGDLMGTIELLTAPPDGPEFDTWFQTLPTRLGSRDEIESTGAALTVMVAAYLGRVVLAPGLVDGLFSLLPKGGPQCHAAAEALGWLSTKRGRGRKDVPIRWQPKGEQVLSLIGALESSGPEESNTRFFLVRAIGGGKDLRAVDLLIGKLEDPDEDVRQAAAEALGDLGDLRAVDLLIGKLEDPDEDVRQAAVQGLVKFGKRMDEHAPNQRPEITMVAPSTRISLPLNVREWLANLISLAERSQSEKIVDPELFEEMVLRIWDPEIEDLPNADFERGKLFDAIVDMVQANFPGGFGISQMLWCEAAREFGQGNYEEGRALLSLAINREPGEWYTYYWRAVLNRVLGQELWKSVRDCDSAIRLRPDLSFLYAERGEAGNLLGDHDEALYDTLYACDLESGHNPSTHLQFGRILYNAGNYKAALMAINRAIELRKVPNAVDYSWLGKTYQELQNYEAVVSAFTIAIDRQETANSEYKNVRGWAHYHLGHYVEAFRDFLEGENQFGLRDLFEMAGNLDRALEESERAIEDDPKGSLTFQIHGLIHLIRDEVKEAIDALNRAVELEPDNRFNHYWLALANIRARNWGEATSALDKDRRLGVLDPVSLSYDQFWRGVVSELQGMSGEAQKRYKLALETALTDKGGDSRYFRTVGLIHLMMDEIDLAMENYDQAVQKEPLRHQHSAGLQYLRLLTRMFPDRKAIGEAWDRYEKQLGPVPTLLN
jgi:tetratricopeptide (TPR) repeat protein